MPRYRASSSRLISVSAPALYAIVADYRSAHPLILPSKYFHHYKVEQGGFGAGTRISFQTTVAGNHRQYHQEIREPEPGHILQEVELTGDLVTTFTFTPVNDQQTRVSIDTEASTERTGWLGQVEAWLTRAMSQHVETRELAQLETVAQERRAV
jgi:Polyketide cyclase / dehydrase and lipid transport